MRTPLLLALAAALAFLAGCYNPRYPSDSPGTERPVDSQQNVSNRDRRDSGAGSGGSYR